MQFPGSGVNVRSLVVLRWVIVSDAFFEWIARREW